MNWRCTWAPVSALPALLVLAWLTATTAVGDVAITRHDERVDVALDGAPFTSYVHTGHRKPILFPVHGPGGTPMTRSWPVVGDVPGEAHDHPHHESIWFTHGLVNGVDFWTSHPGAGKPDRRAANRIEQVELLKAEGGREGVIEARHRWVKADGRVVCTDTARLVFAGDARVRTIDYSITLHADHGAVTLGDTKEGAMGLRVPTPLQLKDLDGSKGAAGHCTNSEGQRDADAWGKAARWVDYWGPLGGRTVGVAVLDHPGNLRHPTRWHARDYGLVAANPFGLHDFTGAPKGSGDHVIPAGESLTLRYLFVFHEGDAEAAGIDGVWQRWAGADAAPKQAAP
ncbi:MAG: PmoA family protein [Planctomycetaceae bacterium]